jgi:F0F1-type ATP synthase delta subunit
VKLSPEEEKQVEASMTGFSSDAKYDLNFEVDPAILGGLQLYFPTAFMDLSLKSRLDKIKEEVSVLTP